MKCRALYSNGARCINIATESIGTGTAPQLCLTHLRIARRGRTALRLAPLNLRAAVEALFPQHETH